jgi:hypothetical protein
MNRLADETSPYLLQHADNPVDWYPWGEEAFARAREEKKPILVSIGYSACHWCHVMERESFEDLETARLMNERFVNIKVDREERPDVDAFCMEAVVALTGRGGWPTTVFLTPDGDPFYAGTYFPPVARSGLPAFRDLLVLVSEAYRGRRQDVLREAATLAEAVGSSTLVVESPDPVTTELPTGATQALLRQFDGLHGGFNGAPKFPFPGALEFLLRRQLKTGQPAHLKVVTRTLDAIARGGIYDHLGGGFHRYAVDASWLVPHFEKMLYDNALLARLYLHAWMVTGVPRYRRVAEETLEHLLRDMRLSDGGFASALDADTEGGEGAFYCWKLSELRALLTPDEADLAIRSYGVTAHGNFRTSNVLHLPIGTGEPDERLDEIRRRLFDIRGQRPRPARDDKVIAAWNGLVLSALAEAAVVLDRADFLAAAEHLAEFLLGDMTAGGEQLHRVWRAGMVKGPGYVEDYGAVAEGLLVLYEASGDVQRLEQADRLARRAVDLFADPDGGGFFFTSPDADPLVARRKHLTDHPTPSGNSTLAHVLLRLARLTGDDDLERIAVDVFRFACSTIQASPLTHGYMLCAVEFHLSPRRELAIIGPRRDPATIALTRVVRDRFDPDLVVGFAEGGSDPAMRNVALLAGKGLVAGRPSAYVCERFTCRRPVTDPKELCEVLDAFPRAFRDADVN